MLRKDWNEAMDGEYEILKYTRDRHPESHIHESYEIFISMSDDGKFFIGDESYPMSVGKMFFMSPFEIHHCFGHGMDYDRYVIHFTREVLQRLSTPQTDLTAVFDAAPLTQTVTDEELGDLLSRLAALVKPPARAFGSDLEHRIRFELFLLRLARMVRANEDLDASGLPDRDLRVNHVLNHIHKHYAEDITLDDLAERFFISKSRLSQIFKNTTGFSVGNYILIYRIKRACILLRNGESVQNTGQLVGFRNNTHFIRMFKKQMGCSPGRFTRTEE